MRWLVTVVAAAVAVMVAADEVAVEADAEGTVGPMQHPWAAVAAGRYDTFPWISRTFRYRTSAVDYRLPAFTS